jgi:hypothetical protein
MLQLESNKIWTALPSKYTATGSNETLDKTALPCISRTVTVRKNLDKITFLFFCV